MVNSPANPDPARVVAKAIKLLVRQGYDATSVSDLADAAGISRSTFFRKFGSKEDIVFADHDRILAQVTQQLSRPSTDPLRAVVDAVLLVFEHHVGNPETSLARYELLQQVHALRDRELVMTHRYQRAFRGHLIGALPETPNRELAAVTFAAAVVALHNGVLREWLRERMQTGAGAKEHAHRLERELDMLSDTFAGLLGGPGGSGSSVRVEAVRTESAGTESARTEPEPTEPASTESARPAVVIAVLDRSAGTEEILKAVREALD